MKKPWFSTSIGRFRTTAIAEGVSFLILLFLAMPLKYAAGFPQAVQWAGWIHGILFIAYMIAGLDVRKSQGWDAGKVRFAVLAAFLPFGPFILDKKILRKELQ